MQNTGILEKYYELRYRAFSWRYNSNILTKIILTLAMACITGLLAQTRIYLPWSPVPITGQTYAVLMSGVFLGAYWGGISQLVYVLIGIAGAPWFAGGKGGLSILMGPTGGYLIGFVLAGFFLGYCMDNFSRSRKFLPMLVLMSISHFILIYVPGLLQLGIWFKVVKGTVPSILSLLLMGMIPFVIGDLIKIVLASGLTKLITPKKSYK